MAAALPLQPFFTSPAQRVALARERFFQTGERPTGLVSEAVIHSWSRCLAQRRSPRWQVAFEPVTKSRLAAALERSHALLQAAAAPVAELEQAMAGTSTRVLLTDAGGVVVHVTPGSGAGGPEPVLTAAARLGVNLSESHVGTNAPAVVARTGAPATVLGAEHFYEAVHPLYCAAAPIRNGRGRLAGVLDLTLEARPFSFDAAALVGVYATMIENRLLQATAGATLTLRFQVCSSMLGSPLEALAGVDGDGRLAWHNGTAQQLLGFRRDEAAAPLAAEPLFGATTAQLLAHAGRAAPTPLRLPSGLTVWLSAQAPGAPARVLASTGAGDAGDAADPPPGAASHDAPAAPGAAPAEGAASLDQATAGVIARTLAECGGNVSEAARRLKVSRGLIYRHLRPGVR
jgi:transcriptional regulator of acetoin/glycerol metabolism